jgi:hypothetical protein
MKYPLYYESGDFVGFHQLGGEWHHHAGQKATFCGCRVEPSSCDERIQNQRHSVMDRAEQLVGRRGDDRERVKLLPVGIVPDVL